MPVVGYLLWRLNSRVVRPERYCIQHLWHDNNKTRVVNAEWQSCYAGISDCTWQLSTWLNKTAVTVSTKLRKTQIGTARKHSESANHCQGWQCMEHSDTGISHSGYNTITRTHGTHSTPSQCYSKWKQIPESGYRSAKKILKPNQSKKITKIHSRFCVILPSDKPTNQPTKNNFGRSNKFNIKLNGNNEWALPGQAQSEMNRQKRRQTACQVLTVSSKNNKSNYFNNCRYN